MEFVYLNAITLEHMENVSFLILSLVVLLLLLHNQPHTYVQCVVNYLFSQFNLLEMFDLTCQKFKIGRKNKPNCFCLRPVQKAAHMNLYCDRTHLSVVVNWIEMFYQRLAKYCQCVALSDRLNSKF